MLYAEKITIAYVVVTIALATNSGAKPRVVNCKATSVKEMKAIKDLNRHLNHCAKTGFVSPREKP